MMGRAAGWRWVVVAAAACAAGCASRGPARADRAGAGSEPEPPEQAAPANAERPPEPQHDPWAPGWWREGVWRESGRIMVGVSSSGPSVREARSAAVESARRSLAREAKGEPEDVQTPRVLAMRLDDGRFRVYTVMSCREPGG